MSEEFVYCPFEDLPADADPTAARGPGCKFTYGSDIFGRSGHWIVVENGTDPVKVYKVPMPLTKMLNDIFESRYAQGYEASKANLRRHLGIEHS